MPETRLWSEWARFLQRWGLGSLTALLLESSAPVNLLLAQLVYIGQPLLGHPEAVDKWQALGQMLENQDESRRFAAYLRKEESS